MIVARAAEIAELTALLKQAAGQHGGTIVLRGEAGIGKSALLGHAAAQATADGLLVLTAAGVPAEVPIPYAALQHLLRPLRVTLGDDDRASPYRIAVDLLDLLGTLEQPVLLAVEDAHWLDRPTWDTLTFLGRRLESDRVALIMTARDGADVDSRLGTAGLPEIRLEPLGPEAAGELLDQHAPGLAPVLRDRVLAEAAGNPLGLVELGQAAARSGAAALFPAALPLNTRVERTFATLVAELPPATRTLLLVAALDDGDDLGEMTAAASLLAGRPVTAEEIEPAVITRLVSVDDSYRVSFRHPLLRSALSQAAGPAERSRAHAALAGVLAAAPDRRLWHRAAAATGPDEDLARELADTAVHAAYRQTVAVALTALERAARLSEDPAERGARLLWAVHFAHEQGDPETVRRLLAEIDPAALRSVQVATLALLRETYLGTGWSGNDRLGAHLDLIEDVRRSGDVFHTLEAIWDISLRVHWSNVDADLRARIVELAESVDPAPGEQEYLQLTILAMVAPIERGAVCLGRLETLRGRLGLTSVDLYRLGVAASSLGAFDLCIGFLTASSTALRAEGRIGSLSMAQTSMAFSAVGAGDVRSALSAAAEAVALSAEFGQRSYALTAQLIVGTAEALRGGSAAATEIADFGESALTSARMFSMLALVQRIRGIDALAAGRYEDAYRQLARVFDPDDPAHHPYLSFLIVGHLAEAALLAGRLGELAPLVAGLEPIGEQSRSPALRAGLIVARAVLADSAAGYDAALGEDLSAWPFERARLLLLYGTWLRRQRQAADSRPHLRTATATFDALGATPWADRARAELRSTGETRRKPADVADALTPHELQIARLAAEGLSNREIGARLFLSPRTVSTHLYKIFPRLGVTSRVELARLLTGDTSTDGR